MILAVALSLLVSVPTAVVIVGGWLSSGVLVVLAALIPIGLAVIAVVGTARADRADRLWADLNDAGGDADWHLGFGDHRPPRDHDAVDLRYR
ncbi:MAG: hypothetical protein AAF962_09755 [Actinomycetota bacterium]